MEFIKKQWKNILFFGFIAFMFTPAGMPTRALLIKGVSYITSRVENLEIDADEQQTLTNVSWQLFDQAGKMVDYNDYKGKVVLVNNWATWCPPCVAEMPSLADLYKEYGDKVVFMFVAHDKPEKVKVFLQKNKLALPVYYSQTALPKLLQSPTIPTTFVISKNGKIVVRKTGPADWNSGQVHKILDKLIAKSK